MIIFFVFQGDPYAGNPKFQNPKVQTVLLDIVGKNGIETKVSLKRKRKNRTAFTAHQIYELEKRFAAQRYVSPNDRDRISQELCLSTAQVITWFQNRRAKQKRDIEELKNDVIATKTYCLESNNNSCNDEDDDDDDGNEIESNLSFSSNKNFYQKNSSSDTSMASCNMSVC
jgi:homeobox protein LBX